MGMRERLPMLMELRQENLPLLEANARDAKKDRDGCSSSSLAGTLRFFGIAEYVVNRNINVFREKLRLSASLHNVLLERYRNGEPIDDSFVTMLSYKEVLDALAANDVELARSITTKIGGRHELEQKHDHPFDLAFGYCLKAVVEMNRSEMDEWCTRFMYECSGPENADFRGYAQALDAIRRKDSSALNAALDSIAKAHANQCNASGVFKDTIDETLCVWGVAIANLAKAKGLAIILDTPVIPLDLIAK